MALVLVVAVIGGGVGVSSWLRPPEVAIEGAASGSVAVSSTTLVCPDASVLGADATTWVSAVSPPLGSPPAPDGQPVTVAPLGADSSTLASVDVRGPIATGAVESAAAEALAVTAAGSLAAGLAATLTSTVADGEVTGVAATSCGPPATEAWFAGIGTEVGHRPRLVLANADEFPAQVDVQLHGADGPLEAATLQGVVVPAGGSVTFELDAVAPDQPQLAVVVRAQVGRVSAGILDTRVDGLDSLGLDWVAPSAPPATRVVLPGVSSGAGPRLLHVLAPGELDARLELRLLTPSGAITPTGLEETDLPAGGVFAVDLATLVGGEVSAIELSSDQPVIAAMRVVSPAVAAPTASAPAEMAYTAGTAALDGPAVMTDVRVGDGWSGTLSLTADDAAATSAQTAATATVRLSYLDATTGTQAATQSISVPPGTTVAVDLAPPGVPSRFSLVVTPSGNGVYAAVQLTRSGRPDAGFTIVALTSPPLEIDVPRVRHDLSTGLRPTG